MRKIYLIRHGQPELPGGERICLGSSELPLSTLGRLQVCLLGLELGGRVSAVFSSPLSRARDTALALAPRVRVLPGLMEQYAGDWEGLSFELIRRRWPELYRARGENMELPMPGAEEAGAALDRFVAAIDIALGSSDGDIAVVAHRSVNRLFLSSIAPEVPAASLYQSYGAWSELYYDGTFRLGRLNILPRPLLDRVTCLALLEAAGLPAEVKEHCKAAAQLALEIAAELVSAGVETRRQLIESAALLHDIARLSPDHAALGARWLEVLGYGAQAEIIRQHHECPAQPPEAAVVSLADKCLSGARRVGLEERFRLSFSKCIDEQARQAHARRRAAALALREKINSICGKEVVP